MKLKIELKILKNFIGYDPESPFIQKYSMLTIIQGENEYPLDFMEVDSRIDYKITLRQAINRCLDRNAFICGRDIVDSKLVELISNGYCEVDL
jgi:hypothetical protein